MIRNVAIFVAAAMLSLHAVQASGIFGSRPDFKDDAEEIKIRLEIVPAGKEPGFGQIDASEYEEFLSRVSRMKQLRRLSVTFLKVPHADFVFPIERLSGLTNLNSLAIKNFTTNSVKVTSLSVCKKMPLKELSVMYVEDVAEMDSIREFKGLEDLSCTSDEMFRCAPSGLRFLGIEDAEVKGSLELRRFYQLETLSLHHVKCSSIEGLGSLSCLESLTLCRMPVKNLSDIKSCVRLKTLYVVNCMDFDGKFDVADLNGFPLEDVEFINYPLSRIHGLGECPLERLSIEGTEIKSVDDICRLPRLKFLSVKSEKIHLKGFENKEHMKELFPKLENLTLTYFDSADSEIKFQDIDF